MVKIYDERDYTFDGQVDEINRLLDRQFKLTKHAVDRANQRCSSINKVVWAIHNANQKHICQLRYNDGKMVDVAIKIPFTKTRDLYVAFAVDGEEFNFIKTVYTERARGYWK